MSQPPSSEPNLPYDSTVTDDALTSEIAVQYDRFQLALENLDKQAKYLNYGYTIHPDQTYEERQAALCLEVFEAARIAPEHTIIDVGFGSGEQDFLWAERFDFEHLQGFNIAPAQVRFASARATAAGLNGRLTFTLGRAEELPGTAEGSVDRLLAVECAFYFDRPKFFKRAAGVLRPGGLLVAADISFADCMRPATWLREDLRRVGTIGGNRREWERHFNTLTVRPIHKEVRPGVQMTVREIQQTLNDPAFTEQQRAQWKSMAFWSRLVALGLATRLLRYDLVVLERR